MNIIFVRKLFYLFFKCRFLYLITNSVAYRELKKKDFFKNKFTSFIFVGEYYDSKLVSNAKNNNHFTLPLSDIRLRPYSVLAKTQVLYSDFVQLIICLLFILFKKEKFKVIFTSIMNSRTLYFLDKLFPDYLEIQDWQFKYIYDYLTQNFLNKTISFKYGSFNFRASHKLKCNVIFPYSANDELYKLISYKKNGDILIIHNPNREQIFWQNINKEINNSFKEKKTFYIIIHPKTFLEDKISFIDNFKYNINFSNIVFTSLEELISNSKPLRISLCYSISSSLDFVFYSKSIPILSPIKQRINT